MKRFDSLGWSLLAALLFAVGCSGGVPAPGRTVESRVEALPYYGDAAFTPRWWAPGSDSLRGFHRIPDFALLNQDGDTLRQADLSGKIYVADFFFTICPGICPQMTSNMAVLQERFATDESVRFLSHSVMPRHDSVPVLADYAERNGVISGKWHLLTGAREVIYELGRRAYFVEEDQGLKADPEDFLHTENFVLVDGEGFIRGIYNGLNANDIDQLTADIETLKNAS